MKVVRLEHSPLASLPACLPACPNAREHPYFDSPLLPVCLRGDLSIYLSIFIRSFVNSSFLLSFCLLVHPLGSLLGVEQHRGGHAASDGDGVRWPGRPGWRDRDPHERRVGSAEGGKLRDQQRRDSGQR